MRNTKSSLADTFIVSSANSSRAFLNVSESPGAQGESFDTTTLGKNYEESVSTTALNAGQINDVEKQPQVILREKTPTGSFVSCSTNLLNTILGTGLVTLASTMNVIGIIPGSCLILLFAIFSGFGLHLLTISASKVGRTSSFFTISKITYPKMGLLFDIAIAVKCYGVATGYLIIVKKLFSRILLEGLSYEQGFFTGQKFILTISMCIAIPLALLRRLDSLKYTSYLSMLAIFYLLILVVVLFFRSFESSYVVQPNLFPSSEQSIFTMLKNLSIIIFAFTCHQNLFAVYNEKRNNKVSSINKVITFSISTASCFYWVIGILSYLTLLKQPDGKVSDNILESYESNMAVIVAQFAYGLLTLFSYPLQVHPCRNSLEKVFPISNETRLKYPKTIFYGISGVIILATFFTAFFVDELGLVLAVVGSTGSVTLCYILPSLFYVKLTENEGWHTKRILAAALGAIGIIVMCLCLPSALVSSAGH
ncbi:Amino acid transporter domain-containing protein [Rozella allomycis CSF55]|uniref:Amino acid transporter domain-containing protein n=1 Tax=Rozella allomycis (strain CSF55) TaxID=988480 RepID=A0A075AVM0_ROZAC|nr:Amino acid transporter domain-containing protein [Rozella allomycis CSF55]|eukprot:EPZ34373.1 Amino acid transporter domain-containing protein [Rozella allomycis CSF55]